MISKLGYLLIVAVVFVSAASASAQALEKESFAILIDSSASMRPQFDIALDAAKEVAAVVAPRGPVSLFQFVSGEDPKAKTLRVVRRAECSRDVRSLQNSIDNFYIVQGATALFDSIGHVATQLGSSDHQDCSGQQRKTIVVITDGEDTESLIRLDRLIETVNAKAFTVYAIGLIDKTAGGGAHDHHVRGQSTKNLERITRETGGKLVVHKGEKPEALAKALFENKK